MRNRALACLLPGLISLALAGAADSSEDGVLAVSGYYKSFFTALLAAHPAGEAAGPASGMVQNALRCRLRVQVLPGAAWEAAYEADPTVGSAQAATDAFLEINQSRNPQAFRLVDLDPRLYPEPGTSGENLTVLQNLDRCALACSPAWGDFILGRQPVAFGSARVVNPMDMFAPFGFQALDQEERSGVDAARVRIPLETMGELDAGYVLGRQGRWQECAGFVKPRLNIWQTDITLLVLEFKTHLLVGLDINRTLGGATVWLETAYTAAGLFLDRRPGEDYIRLSAGGDYQLTPDLYGFLEYHFNGPGSGSATDFNSLTGRMAYQDGTVYLLGRHYLCPGLIYQITPLWTGKLQMLWNVADGSCLWSPALSCNFAENVELAAGGFVSLGSSPDSAPGASAEMSPASEFGAYPDILYTALRFYF